MRDTVPNIPLTCDTTQTQSLFISGKKRFKNCYFVDNLHFNLDHDYVEKKLNLEKKSSHPSNFYLVNRNFISHDHININKSLNFFSVKCPRKSSFDDM